MRSSERRTPIARRADEDPSPARVDTIPPESESHPGPLEDALDRAIDTIPTPPPESGIVDHLVIPPLPPLLPPDERR